MTTTLDYIQTHLTDADLEHLTLLPGWHVRREDGLCVLEAVSWFAGLAHSDQPDCTDWVIAAYARTLNDALPDEQRDRLIPYIPKLAGTADGCPPEKRALIAADRAVRVFAPLALRAAGLTEEAVKLESLPVIDSADSAAKAAGAADSAAKAAAGAAKAADNANDAAANAAWAAVRTADSASRAVSTAYAYDSAAGAARSACEAEAYDEAFKLLDELIEAR